MPARKAVCEGCGAADGAASRCPHCHALADVAPHSALGFRCLVCGGPRIALDLDGVTLGPAAARDLIEAGREQSKHLTLTAAGLALLGMGALAVLVVGVVVLAATPSLVPTLAAFLGASVPLGAGAWALKRAGTARELRAGALQRARVSALADVQAVTGALDARRAAEVLRLSPEQAELVLAQASIESLLGAAPPPRLRVQAGSASFGDEPQAAQVPREAPLEPARKSSRENGS